MILKGYIFSRPFFEERVPQHVQNIIIRNFCKKNNYEFLLSSTEYNKEKSVFILMEILENLKNLDGLIFYSLLQLPANKKERFHLYKKILDNKKSLHFAVEDISVKNKNDLKNIEEIFTIKLSQMSTKNLYKLGKLKNFVSYRHKKVKRNYVQRVNSEKIRCMKISKKYSFDYWDGNRKFGYGGYKYIPGYHKHLAEKIISNYSLNNNSRILDIGCGKGFLLYEIKKILKDIKVYGTDISTYAKKNSIIKIKKNIKTHDARKKFNYSNNFFDLVISINMLHNFKLSEIHNFLLQIEKIGKNKFICLESFRNEKEQFNLQCWALTAETLIDVASWKWIFERSRYTGDYEFIYFE